jgi:hypothetical protein
MWNGLSSVPRRFLLMDFWARLYRECCQGRPEAARRGSLDDPVGAAGTMVEQARQGLLGASGLCRGEAGVTSVAVVGGLRGLDDAPANSGSAVRHTDVRGLVPHVGYPQEVAPD